MWDPDGVQYLHSPLETEMQGLFEQKLKVQKFLRKNNIDFDSDISLDALLSLLPEEDRELFR